MSDEQGTSGRGRASELGRQNASIKTPEKKRLDDVTDFALRVSNRDGEIYEPLDNHFAAMLVKNDAKPPEGFFEDKDIFLINLSIGKFYQKQSKSIRFAIDSNKYYIGIVSRKKGDFYCVLIDGYGFNKSDAMRLACIFDTAAAKALNEGVEAVAASFASQGNPNKSVVADSPAGVTARFADRPDKTQTPLEFLELHYGRWLRGNGLYQHTLRKLDKSLMQHLDRRFVGRRDELAAIIPNKRSEIDARLGPDAEHMSPKERKRALDALRMKI